MKFDKSEHTLVMLAYGASGVQRTVTVTAALCVAFDGSLLTEKQTWELLRRRFPEQPWDSGMRKSRGSFAVAGEACAPLGRPVPAMTVSVRCGPLSKAINVFGDRSWQRGVIGWKASAPQRFSLMPLGLDRAYGGPGWASNPAGRGWVAVPGQADGIPLPNLELPGSPCGAPGDRPALATYLALPPDAPQRTRWLGRFDKAWLKSRFPHLPEDTDPRFYDGVDADQCIDGYFRGDEEFEVYGMHADHVMVHGRLPGKRARLLWSAAGASEEIRHAGMDLDTVWLFPTDGYSMILCRAVIDVEAADAADLGAVRIVWESLQDPPASAETLARQWQHDQTARREGSAKPVPAAPATLPEAPDAEHIRAARDAVWHTVLASHERMIAEIKARGAGLGGTLMNIRAPQHDAFERALGDDAAHNSDARTDPAADIASRRQAMLSAISARLRQAGMPPSQVAALLAPGDAPPRSLNALTEAASAGTGPAALKAAIVKELQAFEAALTSAMPRTAPPMPAPAPGTPSAPSGVKPRDDISREEFLRRAAGGGSLRDVRLTAADLSGQALEGIDMRGSEFVRCTFAASRMSACNLSDTRFIACDLAQTSLRQVAGEGAHLRECKLDGAALADSSWHASRWERCLARNVDLGGARLPAARWSECDLSGALATHADAVRAEFRQCDLSNSVWQHASLMRTFFSSARVDGADFSASDLSASQWEAAIGHAVDLRGAQLANWRVCGGTRLMQARLDGANATGASLRGSSFEHSRFDGATLDRAVLLGCCLAGTYGDGVSAKSADFTGSDFSHARWKRSNFMAASLRRCRLVAVRFDDSNFYGVQTTGSVLDGVSLERSLLIRCSLPGDEGHGR